MIVTKDTKSAPRQARSIATYERLLSAAQDLLADSGIEGFNSNAIVERAGMTPPALYRWFPNKHAILEVLGQRLMDLQNEPIEKYQSIPIHDREAFITTAAAILDDNIRVTQEFRGGYTLMVSMRAIPALAKVRLGSHEFVANRLAEMVKNTGSSGKMSEIHARTRLATELAYGTIEMLFETGFKNRKTVIERASLALVAIVLDD